MVQSNILNLVCVALNDNIVLYVWMYLQNVNTFEFDGVKFCVTIMLWIHKTKLYQQPINKINIKIILSKLLD